MGGAREEEVDIIKYYDFIFAHIRSWKSNTVLFRIGGHVENNIYIPSAEYRWTPPFHTITDDTPVSHHITCCEIPIEKLWSAEYEN